MKAAWLVLVLLLPTVGASSTVQLDGHDDVWNGVSSRTVDAPGVARLWLPAAARLHAVEAVTPRGNVSASWRVEDASVIVVDAPAEASSVLARFDLRADAIALTTFVAPDSTTVSFEVHPPSDKAVAADGVDFAQGADGVWRATLPSPRAGDTIVLRVIDPDRVGELPIALTVVAVALVSLAGIWAWHKARPPNEGRAANRFLEHLAEAQARLMPVALVFILLNFVFFASGLRLVRWQGIPLVAPTFSVESSLASRAFEAFAQRLVPAGVQLVVLRPADAVLAQVQMTLFLAFVAILPALLYEVALFVGPALKERERRAALRSIPLVLALFAAGCAFGYLVMAPLMISTLYGFAPATGALPLLVIGDLISFALLVIVAFGLAFQLPVLMYTTARFGLVKARTYRRYLRHALVVIVIVAGVVTPDPSVVSQLLVAIPVTALYLLGMLAASLAERSRAARVA